MSYCVFCMTFLYLTMTTSYNSTITAIATTTLTTTTILLLLLIIIIIIILIKLLLLLLYIDFFFKNIAMFSEKTDVPVQTSLCGNFSHEAVTLKIRPRSSKSNKLLILSDLYSFATLATFHPMAHAITCRQTHFGLNLMD